MKIPISKPFFDEEDFAIITRPLQSGWVMQGPFVKDFEKEFSAFIKSPYCVATTSGTTALHVALASAGIKQGDEVIVPAFTWIATANAVEYCGAKPVFCDIDLRTFNIDTTSIESLINEKTKAIVPVHMFGLPADMNPLLKIAATNNLLVIEDAACGFGSYYKGKHVGTFGDLGCFSFHPRKAITTGEGGMVVTKNKKCFELCVSLRDHGADHQGNKVPTGFMTVMPEFNLLGYNYRMTDIQAALGVTQLKKAKSIQEKKTIAAQKYNELLKDIPWLQTPYNDENSIHGFQSYVCLFSPEIPSLDNLKRLNSIRNKLISELESRGISTRQGTHAVTSLGFYTRKYSIDETEFPNSLIADRLSIALPLFPQITVEEQRYVVDNITGIYETL